MNYKLLRANNALSQLTQDAAFVRMPDALARRLQRVDDLVYRVVQAQRQNLASVRRRHEELASRLRHQDMRVRLSVVRRQLEQRTAELGTHGKRLLSERRTHAEQLAASLGRAAETVLLRNRSRWERLDSSLAALSPKAILARGYALVFDSAGNLVKEAAQLKAGDTVRTQLARGEFTATVDGIQPRTATE
jgi:exodeoxyribonuclease VII large subunit